MLETELTVPDRRGAMLQHLPDGCIELDTAGRCLYANPSAEQLLGFSCAELGGRPVWEVLDASLESQLRAALGEGRRLELEHQLPESRHWLDVRLVPLPEGGACLYLRDITPRRQAEEELRQSQKELADFFDNAAEGLHWVGPDGRILWANQAELDLLGYTKEEYIGRSITEFHADSDKIEEILCRLSSGEELRNYEARLRRKDGSIRHVLIHSNVLWYEGKFIHTRCFTRDITERRQAEDALRAHAEALQAADRRKDEFLAMLAHELRNPLAPILTAVEIFRIRGSDDPVLQRQRDVVERQVRHMKRLLDDLLEVSRITRGKIRLDEERLVLGSILTQAVEMSRPLIDERQHTLHLSIPEEPLEIEGDAVRLAQVFTNLLNNAAKYTEPGGEIWVSAAAEEKHAAITVRDNGCGMSPEMMAEAFELFSQGSRTLDRAQGGLGIGLTLVKRLVEMHGGDVSVRSDGPNRGTEFLVRLPRFEV